MAKILIIEDYPNIRKVYETVLTAEGHDVVTASEGKEALEKATAKQPDLILLDLLMPGVSGLDFLRAYNIPEHPDTKVIVFSNLSSPELAKEAAELGASKYFTKSSLTPKELATAVKETLSE